MKHVIQALNGVSLNDVATLRRVIEENVFARGYFDNCQTRYLIADKDDYLTKSALEEALNNGNPPEKTVCF